MKVKKLRKLLKPYKNCEIFIEKNGFANIYKVDKVETKNSNIGQIYLIWEGNSDLWDKGCNYARSRLRIIKDEYDNSKNKTILEANSPEVKLFKDIEFELENLGDTYIDVETDTKEKIKQALSRLDDTNDNFSTQDFIDIMRGIK